MTLKGKQNHYNVKFLKGYGFSVKLHNKKIQLKNNYDPFSEPQIEEHFIHKLPYEKIVLQGNGYISTDALKLLTENGRQLLLVDHEGNPTTMMNGLMSSWTSTDYRIGQYDTFRNAEKRDYLSRQIVNAKIDSQIKFLESTKNPDMLLGLVKIKDYQKSFQNDPNPIAFESKIAKVYFTEYSKLFPKKYDFDSRNQSKIRISKNNATDVINGLLNYGYAVLASEIAKFINGIGLDPFYGFYHKRHVGFQALVYDLIEPFRWIVDYSVYKIANHKDSRKRIKLKELAHDRNGTIRMNYDLISRFLELLERNFVQERRYEYRHGAKTKDGLKSVQEITIAKIMVQNLAEFCTGKQKEFRIFFLFQ